MMAIQAVRNNVARQIAVMSGGEYAPFTTERGFEARVQEIAKHARNRYLLSFDLRIVLPDCTCWRFGSLATWGPGWWPGPATGRWKSRRNRPPLHNIFPIIGFWFFPRHEADLTATS